MTTSATGPTRHGSTRTYLLPLAVTLTAICEEIVVWLAALLALLLPFASAARALRTLRNRPSCTCSSASTTKAAVITTSSRAPPAATHTQSTLRELVEAANVAARVLRHRLPQRELLQQVADFLIDTCAASGALEWRSMNVAARFGCLDLLHVLYTSSSGCGGSGDMINHNSLTARTRYSNGTNRSSDDTGCSSSNSTIICTSDAMDFAAQYGHLTVVQWLHVHCCEGCSTAAMDGAAANGHLETLKWLAENRTEGFTPRAVDQAAANGHTAVLQWLLLQCGSCDKLLSISEAQPPALTVHQKMMVSNDAAVKSCISERQQLAYRRQDRHQSLLPKCSDSSDSATNHSTLRRVDMKRLAQCITSARVSTVRV